jgi:hypothetical protein
MISATTVMTVQAAMGAVAGTMIVTAMIAFRQARYWRSESSDRLSLGITLAALLFFLIAASELLAMWSMPVGAQDIVQRLLAFVTAMPFLGAAVLAGGVSFALARQPTAVAVAEVSDAD